VGHGKGRERGVSVLYLNVVEDFANDVFLSLDLDLCGGGDVWNDEPQ
jgi:hypothetical protein